MKDLNRTTKTVEVYRLSNGKDHEKLIISKKVFGEAVLRARESMKESNPDMPLHSEMTSISLPIGELFFRMRKDLMLNSCLRF